MCRPSVLETATSSGVVGGCPSDTCGMPGPCGGAPKAVEFRAELPSLIGCAAVASGAAAFTPGEAATRAFCEEYGVAWTITVYARNRLGLGLPAASRPVVPRR